MKTLSERIIWLMQTYNLSQTDLAKIAKVKQPSVAAWVAGKTLSLKAEVALAICEKLPVMYEWLVKGNGEPLPKGQTVEPITPDESDDERFVKIKVYKIRCSAGPGYEPPTFEVDETAESKSYRQSWLQKHQIIKDKLMIFTVSGDSMEPLLWEGDSITVNTSEKEVLNGKVYVFTYRGEWRVKRLRKLLDGGLLVISENPSWKDEEIPADQTDQVFIIGRVVDRSGNGGL